jgi:hypothetical protein
MIIMREIPVDMTRVRFVATGKGAARMTYKPTGETNPDGSEKRKRTNEAEVDDQGRTIYIVDCLVDDPLADRAEIAAVKVPASRPPVTTMGQELEFVGLVAIPYAQNGRVMTSYRCGGIIDRTNAPAKQAS